MNLQDNGPQRCRKPGDTSCAIIWSSAKHLHVQRVAPCSIGIDWFIAVNLYVLLHENELRSIWLQKKTIQNMLSLGSNTTHLVFLLD